MPNAWPAMNDCMRIGWRSDPEWLHREDATTPDCDFSPRLCMVASSTSILCAKTVVERLFSVIPMRRVVRRQNDEFSDHSALRMSRYRAKDGIRAGCIELIGRGLGCSRRNVKVDPVLLAIRRLDDERVLDGANVGEFDPRGNPCSDLDSLRFETKPIEGADVNDRLGRGVDHALRSLHVGMLSVTALGGDGVVSVAGYLVRFCVQGASRVLSRINSRMPSSRESAFRVRSASSPSAASCRASATRATCLIAPLTRACLLASRSPDCSRSSAASSGRGSDFSWMSPNVYYGFDAANKVLVGSRWTDRAYLREISPAEHADEIRVPVLLGHGTDDQSVHIRHTDGMASALESAGVEFELYRYFGEIHGFLDERTRIDFY